MSCPVGPATRSETRGYDEGTGLRTAWCGRGTRVQWADYWLADHLLGIFASGGDVVSWMNARFANQAFTPTCN